MGGSLSGAGMLKCEIPSHTTLVKSAKAKRIPTSSNRTRMSESKARVLLLQNLVESEEEKIEI
jgi:hypothetical protein